MKIDVTQPLYNMMSGEVMKKKKVESINLPNGQVASRTEDTDENITFRSAVMACLYAPDESLKDNKEEKADRFELAMLIKDNDEVDFRESDEALIRKVVDKFEGTMVYGQVNRILKGQELVKDGSNGE